LKTFQIYSTSKELPNTWDSFLNHDVFLQSSYLKALEKGAPSNIQLFYVGVFDNETLVGIAILQRVQLYLHDMFRKTEVSCFKAFFKNIISKVLKGNILVVGNLTQTGQHGIYYDKNRIHSDAYFSLLFNALETLKNNIKTTQNKTIRAIMLKDFFLDDNIYINKSAFNSYNLNRVSVQPNMILTIQSNWLKIDDYVNDLHKKYRDRYKRAKKKLGNIKRIELDLESIKANSEKLHKLYLNVSNNAQFNTFILPENHFYSYKLQLKGDFKVFGYYLENKLIGFYTLILSNDILETYFLGYDIEQQYNNQLYLNMLYDMLAFGIENRYTSIIYARTAMEIKSSVGAKPKAMVLYMKHTNRFFNALLKPVFKLMNPSQNWQERHPFKEQKPFSF